MVEYYKTQKGYCYKKTQKGGSKRISNKDYEKKTKLKSGGTGSGSNPVSPPRNNTTSQKDKVKYFIFDDIEFDLDSDYDKITEEINMYITNYEITNKISIKKKKQEGGKQNKRKKKNQKGGVDLNLLLKKLKCFGNTDGSQNAIQQNEQQQSGIQDIFNVYNHMDNKYTIKNKKKKNDLQNNANLPLSAFEKLSKDIINESIPDFNPSDMINTIKENYSSPCNTNKPQQQQNSTNKVQNNYNSSDVFKLVIAFCVLILNKLDFIPEYRFGNREANKITVFGYIVYLLALLFLKILKQINPIEIEFIEKNNNSNK